MGMRLHKKSKSKKEPVKDILSMIGKFRAPKGKDALKAREYMENHYERC